MNWKSRPARPTIEIWVFQLKSPPISSQLHLLPLYRPQTNQPEISPPKMLTPLQMLLAVILGVLVVLAMFIIMMLLQCNKQRQWRPPKSQVSLLLFRLWRLQLLLLLLQKTTISKRNQHRQPVRKRPAKATKRVARSWMAALVLMEVVPECYAIKSHLTRFKDWSTRIQAIRLKAKQASLSEHSPILCLTSTRASYVSTNPSNKSWNGIRLIRPVLSFL